LDQESSAGGRLWKVTDRGRLVLDTLMPYII